MDQGEGVEGAERKRDPLDFALWKAHKPDEDTWWESPWGPRPAGLAHRVLGHGRVAAGARLRDPRRRRGLIFPHHENEAAQTRAARGEPLARLWVHNGMVRLQEAKMAKSVGQHLPAPRGARRLRAGRPAHVLLRAATTASRSSSTKSACQRRAAQVRRIREAARGLEPGPSPEWSAPLKERFFDALWPTTSTRRRRWPPCSTGSGRPTAPASRRGRATCGRCSPCWAGEPALRRCGRATRPRCASWPKPAGARARGARLRRGGPAA